MLCVEREVDTEFPKNVKVSANWLAPTAHMVVADK
jgi:hypothetical protein